MAGYPYSGKTYVVNKILEYAGNINVICPKSYRPKGYDFEDEDEKHDIDMAAWQCSLEDLESAISNKDQITVFDTACSSLLSMAKYFQSAKKNHRILYVYVNANIETCRNRAGEQWLKPHIVSKYKFNFTESIPRLSKMADRCIIINNNVGEPNIKSVLEEIHNANRIY